MNKIIRTKLYAAICCAVGTASMGALCTAAQATEQDPPSKTVKFTDLNIQTPEGASVLYQRIRVAARDVCELSFGSDPVFTLAEGACIDAAIDKAVKKVNAPYLTALRFGGATPVRVASK
jgi:UrcA family protein